MSRRADDAVFGEQFGSEFDILRARMRSQTDGQELAQFGEDSRRGRDLGGNGDVGEFLKNNRQRFQHILTSNGSSGGLISAQNGGFMSSKFDELASQDQNLGPQLAGTLNMTSAFGKDPPLLLSGSSSLLSKRLSQGTLGEGLGGPQLPGVLKMSAFGKDPPLLLSDSSSLLSKRLSQGSLGEGLGGEMRMQLSLDEPRPASLLGDKMKELRRLSRGDLQQRVQLSRHHVSNSSVVQSSSSSSTSSVSSSLANKRTGALSALPCGVEDDAVALLESSGDQQQQRVFQQSQTSSSTAFSSESRNGEVQANMTRLQQQQHTTASTDGDGVTSVQQLRDRQLEAASVQQQADGSAQLQARRARVQQQAQARSRGDGVTEVEERVAASGAVRQADLQLSEDGSLQQAASTGRDFSTDGTISYVHEAGDAAPAMFQLAGAAGGWQLPGFGPLIVPPAGGRIRGQFSVRATQNDFSIAADGVPTSINRCEFSASRTFELSESESDSDSETVSLPASRPRRRLLWRHKPAITFKKSPQLTAPPAADPSDEAASEAPSEALTEREADLSEEVAQAEEEQRCRTRLQKIASELLTTERAYVQRLHLIDQVFRVRVEDAVKTQRLFNTEICGQIFSNCSAIHQFHRDHLLPRLESRINDWQHDPRIGDIMKSSAPFLKIYADYVKNYGNSMKLINAFQLKSAKFAAIMEEIYEMEESVGLPLQHHMIVPIQRVPRYEMLLKDYIKRLPTTSPDYEDSKKALELVTHAATHSNETMKGVEKLKQLLEIQENIAGGVDLVSPTRQLLRQGKVCKISARGGEHQERHLFLFTDLLLLCSTRLIGGRIISGPAFRLRARFDVASMQVLEGDNLQVVNTFYIVDNNRRIELYTQTAADKTEWLDSMCSAMSSLYQRQSSLRRGAGDPGSPAAADSPDGGRSEQLGSCRPAQLRPESASRCMDCDAPFSVVRRRHACHACGLIVCGKCSPQKMALPYSRGKPLRVCSKCVSILSTPSVGRDVTTARRQPDVTYSRGNSVLQTAAEVPSLVSGWLQLRLRRSWLPARWFCLRENLVLYSYSDDTSARALTATPCPGLTALWLGAGGGKADAGGLAEKERDRSLRLTRNSRSYVLMADDKLDISRWLAALQKASHVEQLSQKQE